MEAKLRSIDLVTVPGKKDDPNYSAVRGHVPNALYKKFKLFCLDGGVDNSEGLEQLLAEYFESKEQPPAPQPRPAAAATRAGGRRKVRRE
jgi:hypothetical protein